MSSAPTILLVEDDEDNRSIYRTVLEHSGFNVVMAGDGLEALRLAVEARPALVLMDITIPLLDGWEVTRRLKADPATRALLVVALTAHAMTDHREKADAIGFDGYVATPVEPKRVIEEIRRLLGEPADQAAL
ncbi:MAG TPA: response regulator [Longimicrobiaceae bacterium]|nr:response regulator [Longimicrobiaceae bacterium]